jgi:hypothetical protein
VTYSEKAEKMANGTENAMTQEHTFRAAELCIEAQEKAVWIETADQPEVSAK